MGVTFSQMVEGFFLHLDSRSKVWGVKTPQIERELVAGALAGMLNDGLIAGPQVLYEVHTEHRPDSGVREARGPLPDINDGHDAA